MWYMLSIVNCSIDIKKKKMSLFPRTRYKTTHLIFDLEFNLYCVRIEYDGECHSRQFEIVLCRTYETVIYSHDDEYFKT